MSFEVLLTDLGDRIVKIMGLKNISNKEMMEKLDVDERTWRRIKRGEAATTLNRLNGIANALDVEINMLIQVSRKRIKNKKVQNSFN